MSDDERLSAWLDDELTPEEAAAVARDLEADPDLVAELEDLARVRSILRSATAVEPGAGVMERIVAKVAGADGSESTRSGAAVVPLARRRGVPTFAAAAAAIAIIAGVVGGLGGTSMLPAVGDLVARHDAAAADAMPVGVDPMPMDDLIGVGPSVPVGLAMTGAFRDDGLVHLVYRDGAGSVVSVFRQNGDTDLDDLADGKVADMGGTEVWSATVGNVHVAVVDGEGYVWTVVGDDDHDTMMVAMMDDLPTRSPSVVDRLRDAADAVVRPWRLG